MNIKNRENVKHKSMKINIYEHLTRLSYQVLAFKDLCVQTKLRNNFLKRLYKTI